MAVTLRPSASADLAWITALERRPDHRDAIGQWSDAEHLDAIHRRDGREHWIMEREARPAGYLIAYDCRAVGAGIYVKRILVDEKERGTGKAALALFLRDAFAPAEPEAERYDTVAEAPAEKCYRMRLSRR